jgi:hypothetical protein
MTAAYSVPPVVHSAAVIIRSVVCARRCADREQRDILPDHSQ